MGERMDGRMREEVGKEGDKKVDERMELMLTEGWHGWKPFLDRFFQLFRPLQQLQGEWELHEGMKRQSR